jgi:nucleotide-binding universal stress UspA family protein
MRAPARGTTLGEMLPGATPDNPIVIAYHGSENARHAIEVAARELDTRRADVLHVWEPLASAGSRRLSGVRSALVGSVSHHVRQHVSVPVLVVPPSGTDPG